MTNTDLATLTQSLPAVADDQLGAASKESGWLPRIQLVTGNSQFATKGYANGVFVIVRGQEPEELGREFHAIPFSVRPKAMDFNDDAVRIFYHPNPDENGNATGEFARIIEGSKAPNSGMMYGLEFLLWLPESQEFATIFFGTRTSRNDIPSVKSRMNQMVTFKGVLIPSKKYNDYFSPKGLPCTIPPAALPKPEVLTQAVSDFVNAEDSGIETVEESESTRER